MGLARLSISGNSSAMFQSGIKICANKNPVFLSVDNNYHFSRKKADWPGLGEYTYARTINASGITLGKSFFTQNSLTLSLGLRFCYTYIHGELITDNEKIRLYAEDHYTAYAKNIVPYVHCVYRMTRAMAVYVNYSYIKLNKNEVSNLFGFGVAYNIYFKKSD